MIALHASEIALRAVLALLATYHLGVGLLSVLSPSSAARAAARLYGAAAVETPQLRYGIRMLGLYALALGSLLALATGSPAEYRAVIVVAAGLQLARAVCRIVLREELSAGFSVPERRNYINATLLVAEAVVLLVAFPA
jgi:hypothetical protein